jgi:hypothetical protein
MDNHEPELGNSFTAIGRNGEPTKLVYLVDLRKLGENQRKYVAFICPNGNNYHFGYISRLDNNIVFIEADKDFLFTPDNITEGEKMLLNKLQGQYIKDLDHLKWIAKDTEKNNTIAGHDYKARLAAATVFTNLHIDKLPVKAPEPARRGGKRRKTRRNKLN